MNDSCVRYEEGAIGKREQIAQAESENRGYRAVNNSKTTETENQIARGMRAREDERIFTTNSRSPLEKRFAVQYYSRQTH